MRISHFRAFLSIFRLIKTTAIVAVLLMFAITADARAGILNWTSNGPYGGLVTVLAVDPKTPTNLYAAGFSGVYKSGDGGSSWALASNGITAPSVDSIVIDPTTPTILYAGSIYGTVFKSIDGAATWTPLGLSVVVAMAIDPLSTTTVYASQQQNGIQKSIDGGATFNPIGVATLPAFPTFKSLVVDPATSTTIYAGEQSNGIYKSTNGGSTWAPANTGFTGPIIQVLALAIDPQTTSTLYAAANTSGGSGLFKSTDSGAHWNAIIDDPHDEIGVQAITVDPQTPARVYIGTFSAGVERSINGGTSFVPINTGLPAIGIDVIAIDPKSTDTLLAGTVNGVFATTTAGSAWTSSSNGLALTTVNAVAVDPHTPATIYAGTTSSGIFKSTDNGGSWTSIYSDIGTTGNTACSTPNVSSLAIDPTTPTTLYAGTRCTDQIGVLKSINGGANWTAAATGIPSFVGVAALAIDPQVTSTIYAASAGTGVYVSINGGSSWSLDSGFPFGTQATSLSVAVLQQAASPAVKAQQTASGISTTVASTNYDGMLYSTDGGLNWSPLSVSSKQVAACQQDFDDALFENLFPDGTEGDVFALCLSLDPDSVNGYTVKVRAIGTPGSAVESGGTRSSVISPDELVVSQVTPWAPPDGDPAEAAACSPMTSVVGNPVDRSGASFYAGGACGVLSGSNDGAQVATMNAGLPTNLQINVLAITPAGGTL
jgi:hypothetical protein